MSNIKIDEIITNIDEYIVSAGNLLLEGKYEKLSELEPMIISLNKEVIASGFLSNKLYAPKLEKIIQDLNILQKAMHEHKDEVQEQISSLTNNKKATVAYAKSDNII